MSDDRKKQDSSSDGEANGAEAEADRRRLEEIDQRLNELGVADHAGESDSAARERLAAVDRRLAELDKERLEQVEQRLDDYDRLEASYPEKAAALDERAQRGAEEISKLRAQQAELEEARRAPPARQLSLEIEQQLARDEQQNEVEKILIATENKMGPHKPTIANDITMPLATVPFVSVHAGFPTVEAPWPAYSPPGEVLGKNKLTGKKLKKVLHRRKGVVLQGHDVGPILHAVITLPPPLALALSAATTALASRKCMFGAAKIVLEQTAPIGSCTLTNWPPTPMLFCFDPVPMPLACAPTSHWNTIRFPMTGMDYLFGWAEIGVDMILSALISELGSSYGPVEGVLFGAAMGYPKDAVKSDIMVLAALHFGEAERRVETTPVRGPGKTFEKTADGHLREVDVPADDPSVRYSRELHNWGDVVPAAPMPDFENWGESI
jgi:hypothetical protein